MPGKGREGGVSSMLETKVPSTGGVPDDAGGGDVGRAVPPSSSRWRWLVADPQVKAAIQEQRSKGSRSPRSLERTPTMTPAERRKAAALRFTNRLMKEACVAKAVQQKTEERTSERAAAKVAEVKHQAKAQHGATGTFPVPSMSLQEQRAWAKKELRINMNLIAEMYDQGILTSQQPLWAQKLHEAACRIQRQWRKKAKQLRLMAIKARLETPSMKALLQQNELASAIAGDSVRIGIGFSDARSNGSDAELDDNAPEAPEDGAHPLGDLSRADSEAAGLGASSAGGGRWVDGVWCPNVDDDVGAKVSGGSGQLLWGDPRAAALFSQDSTDSFDRLDELQQWAADRSNSQRVMTVVSTVRQQMRCAARAGYRARRQRHVEAQRWEQLLADVGATSERWLPEMHNYLSSHRSVPFYCYRVAAGRDAISARQEQRAAVPSPSPSGLWQRQSLPAVKLCESDSRLAFTPPSPLTVSRTPEPYVTTAAKSKGRGMKLATSLPSIVPPSTSASRYSKYAKGQKIAISDSNGLSLPRFLAGTSISQMEEDAASTRRRSFVGSNESRDMITRGEPILSFSPVMSAESGNQPHW